MSIQAMTWAWGLEELPLRESMVLLSLADQANDQGLCWPSQDTLAKKSRSSLRSVKRALGFLKSAGLIEVEHRGGQSRRLSNRYRLNIGAEFSLENNQRANLALSETAPVDNFDEIGTFPCEQTKGSDWHLVESESSLSATGGTQSPFNKTKLNSIPNHLSSVKAADGGLDGLDGLDENSESDSDVSGVDWDLIRRSVPPQMADFLAGTSAQVVSGLLADAKVKGWTEREILRRLAANQFPVVTRNAAGLVIHRVKEVLSAPVPGGVLPPDSAVIARNARYLAEVERILAGDSELDFKAQEDLLASYECGHYGVKPEGRRKEDVQAVLHLVMTARWAQEDAQSSGKDAMRGGLKVV